MNRIAYSAALLLLSGLPARAGQITFVYPQEGASIPAVPKTFIFGNISPSTAAFAINGEKIAVHSNGGFIAYLPVAPGDFIFTGTLEDGATAQRLLKVRQPAEAAPSTGALRVELTSYASDSEVFAGDYLKITAAGTPSREAVCSLEGVFKDLPMAEMPQGSGRYYASYRVKDSDTGPGGELAVRFKAGLFAHGAAARSRGKIKVLKQPVLVETSTDTVILKNAADGGYMMFLSKGIKLVSNGRSNGLRRVFLSNNEAGWVDDSKVQAVPGAQFPFSYGSETGAIRFRKTDFGSAASVTLYDRLPYTAEVMPWGLRVTLYYANLHTNTVVYDSADTLVKNVAFRQAAYNKVELDFETEPGAFWGYNISYPGSSRTLQVELRARPKAALTWPKPLSGLTVVLDPGHSPYLKCDNNSRPPLRDIRYSALQASARCSLDGAVGPMETFEVNVNLAIALKLKEKLLDLGAQVRLTRSGDENVDLADRPKLAKELGGDLFLSIHNNAIGDGEDPFALPRGFSIYHYQRHSGALAAAVHRSYLKNIELPDEGLRYGDFLVARMTWMPAVLIENAYMILPRQEEQLNTPAFQEELSGAIAEGVLEFLDVPARTASAKKGKQ
ncbi:MAG: N-acetylmuramoyl-L-alanine amidase [Elusimicrobia bacterium]|nr:N-acetylmuramoyl-L-alanine amidase [Elusimicrobiota bacterium]